MKGVRFAHEHGIAEAHFEFSGREWIGIGATECEALTSLLHTMAIDFEVAASAPMGFDVEQVLAMAAGRGDALAYDCERMQDRIEELELLNNAMAQQYGLAIAEAHNELDMARMRIASLEQQLDLRRREITL